MAFFGGMFDDDSIFSGHMRQMNQIMSSFDVFNESMRRPMQQSMVPFGFPSLGGFMVGMNDPNCLSYHSSTFTTMTNGPDGQPQIYRSSQSTRTAPGGLKETKKSVSDSRTGTKRLAIGRHIGERGHVRERVQNYRSGEREESEDFINLEEDQAEYFNREWQRKTRGHDAAVIEYPERQLALTAAPHHGHSSHHASSPPGRLGRRVSSSPRRYNASPSPVPIIEEPDDDDDDVVEIRTEKTRKRRRDESIPETHNKTTKRNAQR